MLYKQEFEIRNARPEEFARIGELMVAVYSQLEGFPTPVEQPAYYSMLLNVGRLTQKKDTELIAAVSLEGQVLGAVVYFSDMKSYGSGGTAPEIENASGFRLLAVDLNARGKGVGKLLCQECIKRTKENGHQELFIHSTAAMKVAWGMYDRLGFVRCEEIDFYQGELLVFGFRLDLR